MLNTTNIIELVDTDWNLKLYPNPATDLIHVQLTGITLNNKLLISIMDAKGKLVFQKEIDSSYEISIPLNRLTKGNYQLIIQQNNKIDHKSFLKH